jgi:hypothetical protein
MPRLLFIQQLKMEESLIEVFSEGEFYLTEILIVYYIVYGIRNFITMIQKEAP